MFSKSEDDCSSIAYIETPAISSPDENTNFKSQMNTVANLMPRPSEPISVSEPPSRTVSIEPSTNLLSLVPNLMGPVCALFTAASSDFKCEDCSNSFPNQQQLNDHVEKVMYVCEECAICYFSEYEYDIHKHDQHRAEYFEYNKLTPRRKRQAIQRLNQQLGFAP